MSKTLDNAIDILTHLVSFESVSGRPTHDVITYIQNYLADHNVASTLSYDEQQVRANLFATIGPEIDGGLVLNGHTDVVPVEGQTWRSNPFKLTRVDNKLYGRGSVDMKGFLACVLASVPVFKTTTLKKPIHIAFSYDEEIGGLGMPVLIKNMAGLEYKPDMVIVGEPTDMQLITGHKGGYEMRTEITGFATHSSNPTQGVNAISAAVSLITKIEDIAKRYAAAPYSASNFNPPYCTFNVGTIEGGTARNATAGWCHFNWEFRPMPDDDGDAIITEIKNYATTQLLPDMQALYPESDIKIITEAPVPPLSDTHADKAATFVSQITGLNSRHVVSFGTDAGYFSNEGLSTVVFGPGNISRAHKPNEFIEVEELAQGLEFLKKVADKLSK
jgi:acetylornithine deacetylase